MFIWTISDAIGVAIVSGAAAIGGWNAATTAIKQRRCSHTDVFEAGLGHAVCQNCRKDLGFIGTWREKQRNEP